MSNTKPESHWQPTLKEEVQFRFGAWLLDTISRILLSTQRVVHINGKIPFDLLNNKDGFIVSMWHENIFISSRLLKVFKLNILASASKDGELATRFANRAGHTCIRGSSSRFGKRALKQLITLGRKGQRIVIMPDGPRGPARKLQGGVVAISQMTGLPIIPFHFHASRQWVVQKSWDGQKFPKPFSTIIVTWGDPVTIPKKMTDDETAKKMLLIEKAMNDNATKAQKYGEKFQKI